MGGGELHKESCGTVNFPDILFIFEIWDALVRKKEVNKALTTTSSLWVYSRTWIRDTNWVKARIINTICTTRRQSRHEDLSEPCHLRWRLRHLDLQSIRLISENHLRDPSLVSIASSRFWRWSWVYHEFSLNWFGRFWLLFGFFWAASFLDNNFSFFGFRSCWAGHDLKMYNFYWFNK